MSYNIRRCVCVYIYRSIPKRLCQSASLVFEAMAKRSSKSTQNSLRSSLGNRKCAPKACPDKTGPQYATMLHPPFS